MIDLDDERNAQRVIEKACPDERVRKIALTTFADALGEADCIEQMSDDSKLMFRVSSLPCRYV